MTTVPALRDDDTTREVMREWLTEQITDSSGLTVAELDRPQGAGGSNETLLVRADWKQDGHARTAELVVRIAPTTLQVSLTLNLNCSTARLKNWGVIPACRCPLYWVSNPIQRFWAHLSG
jgi:hypothetical protein